MSETKKTFGEEIAALGPVEIIQHLPAAGYQFNNYPVCAKEGFLAAVKACKPKVVYHHDMLDITLDTAQMNNLIKAGIPVSEFKRVNGGIMLDREVYYFSDGAIINQVFIEGE